MKEKAVIAIVLIAALICLTASALASDKYDLNNYGWKYVDCKGRGSLVFQEAPGGKAIKGHKFNTGDSIYVNLSYRKDGYAIAYENGVYGYVDASYIDWGDGYGPADTSGTARDLTFYAYMTVRTKGRGTLVFQTKPGGEFMPGYKYNDGDQIYVNVYYRLNGYALAYKNGVYGYVDASYIDWESGGKTSSVPAIAKDFDDFDWFLVKTNGRGSLVFQEKPKGSVIKGHTFYDGEWIYANRYYRKDGYAVAYDDGVFGFVDASYINWND